MKLKIGGGMKWMAALLMFTLNGLIAQNSIAFLSAEVIPADSGSFLNILSQKGNFTRVDGLILVEARIDGQTGTFLFDTGSPGLVLNADQREGTPVSASSISKNVRVHEIRVNSFEWNGLQEKNLNGWMVDIDHLAEGLNTELAGLIGYEVFRHGEVYINQDHQYIRVLNKKDWASRKSHPALTIPFYLEGHLPVIKVRINGQTYRFGLDTGAESNLMDAGHFNSFEETIANTGVELMQGLDGGLRKVQVGQIPGISLKKTSLPNQKFIFADLGHLKESSLDYQIDGLIGLQFLQGFNIAINYQKRRIYCWPRTVSGTDPLDDQDQDHADDQAKKDLAQVQ